MKKKIKIAPSILASNFSLFGNEIIDICRAGADYIHFDIMDGHFVPNLTFGPDTVKHLRKYTKKTFDVHLMIKPVDKFLIPFIKAGADIISFHPETVKNVENTIKVIKSYKKKVGLVLNPNIKENKIYPYLSKIDLILVMSVYPGFGGQKFIPEVVNKIKELKNIKKKQNIEFDIEVDGGINFDNSKLVITAGANILVSGTTIFKENNGNIKKNIDSLKLI
mgnify:CR=1 FL=1